MTSLRAHTSWSALRKKSSGRSRESIVRRPPRLVADVLLADPRATSGNPAVDYRPRPELAQVSAAPISGEYPPRIFFARVASRSRQAKEQLLRLTRQISQPIFTRPRIGLSHCINNGTTQLYLVRERTRYGLALT